MPSTEIETRKASRAFDPSQIALGISIAISGFVVIGFSPLLAFFALTCFQISASRLLSNKTTLIAACLQVVAAAICVSSRQNLLDPSDDLIRNYTHYTQILQGDLASVIERAIGTEILYYGYIWLITVVLPPLSPPGLMLVFTLTVGTFALVFLNQIAEAEKIQNRGEFWGASLLFFSFFTVTQLTRQSLASCILIFALLERRPARSIGIAVLAFLFHNSSALGYILGKILIQGKRPLHKLIVIICTALAFYAVMATDSILNSETLSWLGVSRLSFWGETLDLKTAILAPENLLLAFVLVAASTQLQRLRQSPIFQLGTGYTSLWFLLLPYNYLSLRVCFVTRVMLFGPFVYITIAKNRVVFVGVVVAYGIYRLLRMTLFFQSGAGMDLWSSYHWYSGSFYYYLRHFV